MPDSGYLCATILGLTRPRHLGLQRNSICVAGYALRADPGTDGTLIRVVDHLRKQSHGVSVDINITIDGQSRVPAVLIDGWVKAAGEPLPLGQAAFRRGDADGSGRISVLDALAILRWVLGGTQPAFACDGALDANDDGRINIADPVHLLQFLLARGRALPPPFPGCGVDPTADWGSPGCRESNCRGG